MICTAAHKLAEANGIFREAKSIGLGWDGRQRDQLQKWVSGSVFVNGADLSVIQKVEAIAVGSLGVISSQ